MFIFTQLYNPRKFLLVQSQGQSRWSIYSHCWPNFVWVSFHFHFSFINRSSCRFWANVSCMSRSILCLRVSPNSCVLLKYFLRISTVFFLSSNQFLINRLVYQWATMNIKSFHIRACVLTWTLWKNAVIFQCHNNQFIYLEKIWNDQMWLVLQKIKMFEWNWTLLNGWWMKQIQTSDYRPI